MTVVVSRLVPQDVHHAAGQRWLEEHRRGRSITAGVVRLDEDQSCVTIAAGSGDATATWKLKTGVFALQGEEPSGSCQAE